MEREGFGERNDVRVLGGSRFHRNCVDRWLRFKSYQCMRSTRNRQDSNKDAAG